MDACSTTSGYSSNVTDMSSVGKENKRPEERDQGIDMEEEAFTPPDGGIMV